MAIEEHADDVREWIKDVSFPILLDRDHVIAEAYDIRNVPTVIWIDEDDRLVRPNDVAFGSDMFKDFHGIDSTPHHDALRRWVTTGELPFDEAAVRWHQFLPSEDEQLARVHWRVAVALQRTGRSEAAARHFAEAGDLSPHDFTIRRGSMPLRGVDPFMSDEFFALYESNKQAGRPGYGLNHPGSDEQPN